MMNVELNTDKCGFLTIGPYAFNWDSTQHDVSLEELAEAEKKQLLYNIQRGVLKTSDRDALKDLLDVQVPTVAPRLQVVRPQVIALDPMAELEKDKTVLRKLLKCPISTVKKETADFRPGRLRRIKELEAETKNRKKLLAWFDQRLEVHNQEVKNQKGTEELETVDMLQMGSLSTQLTDIVESEEEQLTLTPEVLNQINAGE